jgi:hypothetical protein
MTLRPQNKLLVTCLAIGASIALVTIAALLDGLIGQGSLVGLALRIVALAAVILCVLVGFNTVCDRCDGQTDNGFIAINGSNRTVAPRQNQAGDRRAGLALDWSERSSSSSYNDSGRNVNGNASSPKVYPVSVFTHSIRSIVPKKKWWVGQRRRYGA